MLVLSRRIGKSVMFFPVGLPEKITTLTVQKIDSHGLNGPAVLLSCNPPVLQIDVSGEPFGIAHLHADDIALIPVGEEVVRVTINEVIPRDGQVKLGFEADNSVSIYRDELYKSMFEKGEA